MRLVTLPSKRTQLPTGMQEWLPIPPLTIQLSLVSTLLLWVSYTLDNAICDSSLPLACCTVLADHIYHQHDISSTINCSMLLFFVSECSTVFSYPIEPYTAGVESFTGITTNNALLTLATELDYEAAQRYIVVMEVVDGASVTGQIVVRVISHHNCVQHKYMTKMVIFQTSIAKHSVNDIEIVGDFIR